MADSGHVYRTSRGSWNAGGAPFVIKVGGDLSDPDIYQPKVVLSNTGQTVLGEFSPTEDQHLFAASFTAGTSRLGYRLLSIGFAMGAITDPSTAGAVIRVTLRASQGYPGYELCTLSPPESFSENAVNRFDASSCPALAPKTSYFVVFERLTYDASQDIEFSTTASLNNDAAGSGWLFSRFTMAFGQGIAGLFGWDFSEFNTRFRVEISGRALLPAEQPEPPEPPAPPRKQVANTGQSGLVGAALTGAQTKRAQAFTTGAHASGYRVHQLRIGFRTVTDPLRSAAELNVTLHEGGGADPGARLCRFDDQVRFKENAVRSLDHLGDCPTLTPNTTYFVVVDRIAVTVATDTLEVSVTASDAEDAARPGWSIADDSRVYDGTNWSSGGGSSLAIDVRAVDIPSEEELRPSGAVAELVPGPVGDLVSNTGQTIDGTELLSGDLTKVAQKFTAGDDPAGYRLSSIGIHFDGVSSFDRLASTTVTLNQDASGDPGDALCTLIDPAAIMDNTVLTFAAPTSETEACPTLEAGATYFVVVEQDTHTAGVTISSTTSAAEDAGGAPGWSIPRSSYVFKASTSEWFESTAGAYLIEVKGSRFVPPPLVSNTGQTANFLGLLDDDTHTRAQSFTTGAHAAGYTLGSIGIRFLVINNLGAAGDELTVTLNADDNGNPGAALCTLSDPASFSEDGLNRFAAPPACPVLAPNTTYLVTIERVVNVGGNTLILRAGSGDDEDAGGAAGWSIGNSSRLLTSLGRFVF